jgi:hypothetical protein
VFIKKETLWKNNLNFVEDVPKIYVNFIITVIIVSEREKKEALLSYRPWYIYGTKQSMQVFVQGTG